MHWNQEEQWLLAEKYGGMETEAFHVDMERLRNGEPLAYIIGHVPFLGCRIYLDSQPLIPRPETEYWVEKAIEEIKKVAMVSQQPLRVLDLCAGSGCIGIAVAKATPNTEVTFVEIDPLHLPTMQKNIDGNFSADLRGRFKIVQSDLFEHVSGKLDFILTNPPYIDPALDRVEESVKVHEPHLALYGGIDGLEIISTVLQNSNKYLNENGQLWIEHEPEQVEFIRKSAAALGIRVVTYTDQYGVNRFSSLFRFDGGKNDDTQRD